MAVDVIVCLLVCLLGSFAEANTSLSWFDFYDAKAISGYNDELIADINEEECARRCLVGTSTVPSGSCLSFEYDNQVLRCILSRSTKDTPGAVLADSNPLSRFDYYHRKASYGPCDFDTDLCQYTQDTTDDFDWTRHSGPTRTSPGGPSVDHTSGSGYYMYIEASSPRQQGDIACLISPSYRPYPDGQCLLFWAHMYGRHIGTLTVSANAGGTTTDIWTRSGDQGNQWFSVALSIPTTGSYQVIFEGVRGRAAHGDIAIDDVSILQGGCPDVDECVPRGGKGPCDQTCTNTDGSYICTCNMGYSLNSDGHACDIVQCPTLPAPENGAVTGGNSYQDVVQFTCNHGYQLIGDSNQTCQADGTWTGGDTTCAAIDITRTEAVSSTEIPQTWSLGSYAKQPSPSQYADTVSTDANRAGSAVIPSRTFLAETIGLAVVSALLLIALAAALAVIVVLKRRLASSKSKREANGTTVQNGAFSDDTYYTDTRTNRANDDDGTYIDVISDDITKRGGTNQDGEYDVPDVGGEEGAYQTLDPRSLEQENNEYQKLAKKRVLKHL